MDASPGSIVSRLPEFMFEVGPWQISWWQWAALLFIAVVAVCLGWLLGRLSRGLLARIASRTATTADDKLVARLGRPLALAWTCMVFLGLLPLLSLPPAADLALRVVARSGFLLVLFWMLARGVGVAHEVIAGSAWAREHPASRSLLPLGARLGQVTIWAFAAVAMLSELGYPVASLLAGLGLGGLALALAAQKTVENLFGAFSIGADQPFREGDFVRVDDVVGTVEAIGLRSTRIRTLDRTVVSLPNGKLAEMKLETFAARDRIRLSTSFALAYGITAAQVRATLSGIEEALRRQQKLWPDEVTVCLKDLGASGFEVEVMAWFATTDWAEFVALRQAALLAMLEAIEHAGAALAHPTRTVHLVGGSPGAANTRP